MLTSMERGECCPLASICYFLYGMRDPVISHQPNGKASGELSEEAGLNMNIVTMGDRKYSPEMQ